MNHCRFLTLSVMLLTVCMGLTGCKPDYPRREKLTLETTISADGLMVAALSNAGEEKPRLRINRLNDDKGWQDIPAPMFTNSVRFGLKGHKLLLTHLIPGEGITAQLTLWNLDDLNQQSQVIHQGNRLRHPIEVNSGEFMVQTCEPFKDATDCDNPFNFYWVFIDKHGAVKKVGPKSSWRRAPNIVGRGFFWIEDRVRLENQDAGHPGVLAYALPNGSAPQFDETRLSKSTSSLECDYKAKRCLRSYISNPERNGVFIGTFVYDVEIFHGSNACHPEGLAGWSDGKALTPSGDAGVMSLAAAYDKPRHVVVMQFKPQQCEPTTIQHLYFEEK